MFLLRVLIVVGLYVGVWVGCLVILVLVLVFLVIPLVPISWSVLRFHLLCGVVFLSLLQVLLSCTLTISCLCCLFLLLLVVLRSGSVFVLSFGTLTSFATLMVITPMILHLDYFGMKGRLLVLGEMCFDCSSGFYLPLPQPLSARCGGDHEHDILQTSSFGFSFGFSSLSSFLVHQMVARTFFRIMHILFLYFD